ncbi:hypothetical protein MMC14_010292 [Varicellaria rhodocarpa]|nr:hypothetical protein [Varicellaria rhodocarpa]
MAMFRALDKPVDGENEDAVLDDTESSGSYYESNEGEEDEEEDEALKDNSQIKCEGDNDIKIEEPRLYKSVSAMGPDLFSPMGAYKSF